MGLNISVNIASAISVEERTELSCAERVERVETRGWKLGLHFRTEGRKEDEVNWNLASLSGALCSALMCSRKYV